MKLGELDVRPRISRKRKKEGRANAGPALDPDLPAMLLDDGLRDGQSHSCTHVGCGFSLPEEIENSAQVFLFDSAACVTYGKTHTILPGFAAHGNRSAFRRELDGIVDEVRNDLENPMAIGFDSGNAVATLASESDPFRPRLNVKHFARFPDNFSWILRMKIERNPLPFAHACNGHEVFDQTIHAFGSTLDDMHHLLILLARHVAGRQQLRRHLDIVNRIAQVM